MPIKPSKTIVPAGQLPILYYKDKKGSLHQWEVWASKGYVYTRHGMVGGKMQESGKECFPTNVGRANHRDAVAQAKFEAKSMHKFKLDRKYAISPEEAEEVNFLPMLIASDFDSPAALKLEYPVHVQPKLDGNRAIAYWEGGKVKLLSRGGKFYNMPHISDQLEKTMPQDMVLDGELYVHGIKCTDLSSLAKKQQKGSTTVSYHVYDIPSCVDCWGERSREIHRWHKKISPDVIPHIEIVRTHPAECREAVLGYERAFKKMGYEGAVVRVINGPAYEWGHRSRNLFKVKTFQDAEFKVVRVEHGRGKMEHCAIFICVTKDGNEFGVMPEGTQEEREAYYTNRKKYIGKKLTVKFFHLTNDGIPFHPVGKGFRDKKDLA